MQHNPANGALLPRPAYRAAFAPEGVTVCMTSAVLAPAPTAPVAGETPVFVDDSGARKRLVRIAGVLLGLLALGFLGLVGVAIATPSVATSVELGSATPFVVPGAAAPPPAKAPAAPVQAAKPKPKPKGRPAQVVAPAPAVPAPLAASSHDEAVTDPTHDAKPHHGKHSDETTDKTTDQTGDHGKQHDHTGDQTGDQGPQNAPTGQTDGQPSPTGQTPQDGQQAPADTPAADTAVQ